MSYGAGKEILEKVRVSVLILIGWFRDEICVYSSTDNYVIDCYLFNLLTVNFTINYLHVICLFILFNNKSLHLRIEFLNGDK